MSSLLDRTIDDLVAANRILAHEGVVDAYGHVSVRHPEHPNLFLLSRSRSPEHVKRKDIMTFALDGTPQNDDTRPPYLERFIHGGIYERRPEINAVVHSHSEDVLPYSITNVPLRPAIHIGSHAGTTIPVWDIADDFGTTDLLVRNVDHGRSLAAGLDQCSCALMRGHGFACAAASLFEAVRIAVYLPINARVTTTARLLSGGAIKTLTDAEITLRNGSDPLSPASQRAWDYWKERAGVSQ